MVATCNMSSLQLVLQLFLGLGRLHNIESYSTFATIVTAFVSNHGKFQPKIATGNMFLTPCD